MKHNNYLNLKTSWFTRGTKWKKKKEKDKRQKAVCEDLTPQLDQFNFCHIQTMKSITKGIEMRATELLPWCIDHPAEDTPVLDDAAEAEVDVLVPLEPVEPVVVVPVGLVAVGSEGVVVVKVWVPTDNPSAVTEPVIERDEAASGGASGVESDDEDDDDDDDDEEPELGAVIWVMAKAGLVSPESPNTIVQTGTS